ncbi:MAG TPA: helix-turn-helix transcriptional regulator [Deltaproteobacteria bacterium]|nr:helix-turn-helix transcriptional regulator [Deltaproteobacteria bacterium]
MENRIFFTTKEVSQFLKINEKMVYTLVAEKGLPATKATGKWLFPKHLVEQWLENRTVNYPKMSDSLPSHHDLLIICGSNDILLDRAMSLFNQIFEDPVAVFGNLGSLGGIRTLREGKCHMASSHLLQDNGQEYNFGFAENEMGQMPGIINFCKREQGLLVAKGNPGKIQNAADLAKRGVKVVNRPLGTGTRLLFDGELQKAGLEGSRIKGYDREVSRHLDVGLEVLSGRADAGPGIRAVAGLLDLDFLHLRWERFDFLIQKARFFEKSVQLFLNFLSDKAFRAMAQDLEGYDLELCGKMVFPMEPAI